MDILLSIRPTYADRILDGTKRYEYRKQKIAKPDIRFVILYATRPVCQVVGEFRFRHVLSDEPAELWSETHCHAGMTQAEFDRYFNDCSIGHAIGVKSPRRYRNPRPLKEVFVGPPPQSFCYLS